MILPNLQVIYKLWSNESNVHQRKRLASKQSYLPFLLQDISSPNRPTDRPNKQQHPQPKTHTNAQTNNQNHPKPHRCRCCEPHVSVFIVAIWYSIVTDNLENKTGTVNMVWPIHILLPVRLNDVA